MQKYDVTVREPFNLIKRAKTDRSGVDNNGVYGTQLNGGTESVPLRPVRSTERNMFVIPRALTYGDNLEVTCTISDPNSIITNLLTGSPNPDYNNIACQLESNFQKDEIALRIIENGEQVIPESEQVKGQANSMMTGTELQLELKFLHRYGRNSLAIFVNKSFLNVLELKHGVEQITFLEVVGDAKVTGLSFTFA